MPKAAKKRDSKPAAGNFAIPPQIAEEVRNATQQPISSEWTSAGNVSALANQFTAAEVLSAFQEPTVVAAATAQAEPKTHEQDPILSLSEVARQLGKAPSTITRWVKDGLLKAVRMPSNLPGVRKSEVNKFLGGSALQTRLN